jgi:hypothetical protein
MGPSASNCGAMGSLVCLIGDPRGLLDGLGVGVAGLSGINRDALTGHGERISGDRLIAVEIVAGGPVVCRGGSVVCRGGSVGCRGDPVVCRAANSPAVSLTERRWIPVKSI